MKGPVECIRCHAHMESGWVADNTQAGLTQQNWSAGEPQPSFWTGLKVEKKDQIVPVTTSVVRSVATWNRTQSRKARMASSSQGGVQANGN